MPFQPVSGRATPVSLVARPAPRPIGDHAAPVAGPPRATCAGSSVGGEVLAICEVRSVPTLWPERSSTCWHLCRDVHPVRAHSPGPSLLSVATWHPVSDPLDELRGHLLANACFGPRTAGAAQVRPSRGSELTAPTKQSQTTPRPWFPVRTLSGRLSSVHLIPLYRIGRAVLGNRSTPLLAGSVDRSVGLSKFTGSAATRFVFRSGLRAVLLNNLGIVIRN